PAAALTSLAQDLIDRYFIPIDGAFEVTKRIRGLIVFGEDDLAQRPPFPRIDLVLCRNVLIYFAPELQTRALQLFAFALRDSGYLVLGKAETPRPLDDFFESVDSSLKIYRRHGARTMVPPTWSKDAAPQARADGHRLDGSSALEMPRPAVVDPGLAVEEPLIGAVQDGLLDDIPLGVVIVDRRYDILTINRAARLFLGIYHDAIGEDVIHLAQSLPGTLLRAAIDAAFRDGSSTRLDQIVPVILATGEECSLEITCRLVQLEAPKWEAPTAMILLNDSTAAERARARQDDEIARLTARMRDMAQANRTLLEANAALTNASMALRRDSVDARADTAEAQAQTEEVITLNEELQATNEEMETLNEELQATIEEVETANDELDSRRLSLMDLNTAMETERAYLELILGSIGDAVLVVDINGTITRTNAAYDALFGPNPTTLVFEDEQGKALPSSALPRHRAARGETFTLVFRSTTADGAHQWFEADGRPLLTPDGGRHGVVVIRDITLFTQHQRLQDEFLSLASHELRTPLTSVLGYLGMLERGLRDPNGNERLRGFADKALHEAERLVLMVRDLTDVSRLQTGKLTLYRNRLNFTALVAQVVELARDLPPGHDIHLEMDLEPLTIDGDAMRLEQVLFNILTNAMFHAPSDRPLEVRLRRLNGGAHLEIEDHGSGIAPALLPRLFSRFYQIESRERASRQGMGLGLFICKELVTAHDGRIEAASTEGEGTTFTVWLPLLEEGS
ncbi:MAG TPA: ATP-binding protein, partial [Chloroflexota bacterium]|nr:ATP-binding protein [Chloroflexota bacterium]